MFAELERGDNRALREAMRRRLPLLWFIGVAPGVFHPVYPVYVLAEELDRSEFVLAVDEGQRFVQPGAQLEQDQRRYVEALTRKRLHQPVFRAQVLRAYETRCAVCALHHSQLLDAAHITQDRAPSGLPLVSNGLSLCKIHHAAYDGNILGIRPDYVVEVRQAVLIETDGPMLRHGIQALHMQKLRCLPKARRDRPDPERLDERWERFRLAG